LHHLQLISPKCHALLKLLQNRVSDNVSALSSKFGACFAVQLCSLTPAENVSQFAAPMRGIFAILDALGVSAVKNFTNIP